MHSASVRSVVAVMPRLFQSRRKAWRTSPEIPVNRPAEVGSAAWSEDMGGVTAERSRSYTAPRLDKAPSGRTAIGDIPAVDPRRRCGSVEGMSAPAQVVILAFNASNQLAVRQAGTKLG